MEPHTHFWIGVACAEHVRRGRAGGFMQLGHGKGAPLQRLKQGDGIVYYSPSVEMGARDAFQSFTAIGRVADRAVYQGHMGADFHPMRRDVAWLDSRETPIRPLLPLLSVTAGKSSWGGAFRFGLLRITPDDFALIARAMQASA